VVYQKSKCIGCRYCMVACPFQVPTYQWTSRLPIVRKCDMCYERVSHGKPTACAEVCPTGATICGDRDQLLQEAQQRIKERPGEYYSRIYGIEEAGGTSVLFLSAVPFEQLALKTSLPHEPLPALTWRALSLVPDLVSTGGVLLAGVWWITHRREKVGSEERAEKRRKP
jgi:formate dehydrogenase iron-sulfur subunit